MTTVLLLIAIIAFIVVATAKFKLHPFLTLLLAAFLLAFFSGLPIANTAKTISDGFGGILGYIGLVIVLGTIIGVMLEKSGAAITMAEAVIRVLGPRFPTLTVSIIGYLVSIPVFCDSGYVILNSLKQSLANRMRVSSVAMSVALATGLYATHTFVPPTPGPIAAAGNLGLESSLGLVIGVGLLVSACAALAGLVWANRFKNEQPDGEGAEELIEKAEEFEAMKQRYGVLPNTFNSFAPIFVPILLICLGSVANFPAEPLGKEGIYQLFNFLGQPLNALLIGLFLSFGLLKGDHKLEQFSEHIASGLVSAAPILLITGAGGAFGAVIKATDVGSYLGMTLSGLGVGIFMPFIVSAALKSAQGSSTVALVTTSALVAPMLGDIGLGSEMGRVLTVMAIGAGAMTVSHANDSFFWVVTQFSKMSVPQAYRAQTMATLVQGVTGMAVVYVLTLILL
ncbi:gluconate transporter [Oceanisphaera profunda]|uniref:Gluconate transporter n=1 Tax=Oceanisphaera profunda TaxID=1416627 RepID=A0A1Y0D2A7_9GAMM|nr:GntP family permease [Oceanisphaera profunda]ART81357.1 gluconate transporter [Oceanisphaera profunda]